MGFIKAIAGAIGTTAADQWKEFIYCDSMGPNVLMEKGQARVGAKSSNTKRDENIISDGSRAVVNEGQCMLVVENGKIVDFVAEPGEYTYQTGTEPSMLSGGFKGLIESFKKVGKRFTYGGQPENDQRVYYVNTKEIMDNKVGVGDVPFRDSEFGFTIKIKGYGTYSYKITDPVLFYTNIAANVTANVTRDIVDEQMRAEVQQSLQPALGKIALKGIAYDQLPLYTKDIADEINKEMTDSWVGLRGISVVSVALASITPDEESAKKIAEFQESRVYTNTQMMGARLGTAQANAMESAAKNEAGAMNGFIGMGFAQQAGGANAAQMFQMAEGQQQAQPPQQQQGQGAAPASGTWTCPCGAVNSGKFCMECGAKKPADVTYKCNKCGWEPEDQANPPKFCPECGDVFDDKDKA